MKCVFLCLCVPEKLLLVSFRASGPSLRELNIWLVAHDPLLVARSTSPSMLRCKVVPVKGKEDVFHDWHLYRYRLGRKILLQGNIRTHFGRWGIQATKTLYVYTHFMPRAWPNSWANSQALPASLFDSSVTEPTQNDKKGLMRRVNLVLVQRKMHQCSNSH